MDRRAYLAMTATAATTMCLAGCSGSTPSESNGSSSPSEDESYEDDGEVVPASGVVEPGSEDDFEDLSNWNEGAGSLSADGDRSLIGTQSARLEVGSSTSTGRVSKAFDEPIDVSNVVPGVAVTAESIVSPWIRLLDEDGNRIDYRRAVSGDIPFMRYNFGINELDDEFDETAVTEIQLQLWTPDETARTVWFDDLHFVPRPETGKVMIQFDDTHVTDHTEALPLLEDYGYEAVTFINPDYVGRNGTDYPRLSESQLADLHDAGWCLSNHTVTHANLPDLDRDEQEVEIREGKEWLEERGYDEGARYFAYPFGDFDATTVKLVDEYHKIGFGGGHPVQGYTSNTALASRISEPGRERAELEFERTARMPGITSVFYHELEDELLTDFEDMLEVLHEYESAGEIDVILPQDLEQELLF
ncbi:polysaccharide deacetylase family protein [Halostagnicola sp. A-GB9-2]|uniref:polysaccharide deacetylase family protein n=1 Tax=Halostagnicola sp. A-GB9-2 TaxID=3048066 RepID=UPI0024C06340|nr:polysaccharide deacetylase family protein [Halostagnicola sp. A-GB9-2]MDJ1432554.1 polysaccharide deacetylase family protein [Halostagnicola sp. A-GB9-2]